MFRKTGLTNTLARVQSFISELETGIKENEKAIKVNISKIAEIAKKETTEIARIKTIAISDRTVFGDKNVFLLDQGAMAKTLLSKLQ